MKLTRPPLLHHTQPQPRPRHARRPLPLLLLDAPHPARIGQRSGRSRPKSPDLLKTHAQHPAETPEPRKNAALLHNMPENRSKRRTRSGRRPPHVGNDQRPAAETYPGTVYISAGRGEARRESTSSTLHPTPNPAPHLSRSSIPRLYPLRSSHPALLHTTYFPPPPLNSLSTHFPHSYLSFLSY